MSNATATQNTSELVHALNQAGIMEVDDSQLSRSLYSSDASLYRIEPQAVMLPRHVDEIIAALDVCRERHIPLTMRGTGTSIAGNAVGPGLIVDTSRYLNRVQEIDPEEGTAIVEPGVVLARLQDEAVPHGWRFGPDPSTHNRATIGGMIGNNACGSRALGYGRTSDNVLGLDVIAGTGERVRLGQMREPTVGSPLLKELKEVIEGELATIRTEFGTFGRQISGYSLEHLLPERRFDVARSLVGSEGTLALTLGARVRLVRDAPVRMLVVLGYGSMVEAADAVPAVLKHRPIACEGLDSRITNAVRARRGIDSVPDLPRGAGWLMVELTGDDFSHVADAANSLVRDSGAFDSQIVSSERIAAALWRIREDGSGLVAKTAKGLPAHAGWEDAAVPPASLGAYLREFEALLSAHGLTGVPYGHFGDGCVHVRIDFPFERTEGRSIYREFLTEAADLVASHGGSMSGEHGDGRARSDLLPRMYSTAAIELFEQVKRVFDPEDLLNPGVIVRPAARDANIRMADASTRSGIPLPPLGFRYHDDRGDLGVAVHRCTGVGKCRADGGGVMCPSFLATRNEKDSTRGRSRVLQDVVSGKLGPDGWRSAALHDALDLCLSCKGCSSDCPTGVDMAVYKAEALHQKYRGRLRPRTHYSLGWLPRWTRLVTEIPGASRLANAVTSAVFLHRPLAWLAGIDARRDLPSFANTSFRRWFAARSARHVTAVQQEEVVLFVDTFTNGFSPEVGRAAVAVLENAGYSVQIVPRQGCCGLTWISTGQLDGARRQITATVQELAPFAVEGTRIVGLEPSCTAVLRSDALELLDGEDLALAKRVAEKTRTLAELLSETEGWSPPDLSEVTGVAQPHCHHTAVLGWSADAEMLRGAGAKMRELSGCCGLAGNFGVERGHYEVSESVAELQLLPATRNAGVDEVILADGFSCRTQLASLSDRSGEHLAQLLARSLDILD